MLDIAEFCSLVFFSFFNSLVSYFGVIFYKRLDAWFVFYCLAWCQSDLAVSVK